VELGFESIFEIFLKKVFWTLFLTLMIFHGLLDFFNPQTICGFVFRTPKCIFLESFISIGRVQQSKCTTIYHFARFTHITNLFLTYFFHSESEFVEQNWKNSDSAVFYVGCQFLLGQKKIARNTLFLLGIPYFSQTLILLQNTKIIASKSFEKEKWFDGLR
jgi:hypothetical protein